MNFGERAAARRKSKELKNELKDLRKDFLGVGYDKTLVANLLKEFQDTVELADTLQSDYVEAGEHLRQAREAIMKLLDCMGESPVVEVQASMDTLIADLEQVYHDCSIREDDIDFQSTIQCLKQMVAEVAKQGDAFGTGGMQAIMLRSELENVKAVLDDAAGWRAPDFLALAYYFLHEDKDNLKEMENDQRNQYVLTYLKENYMDDFLYKCKRAGIEERIQSLMQEYIYE